MKRHPSRALLTSLVLAALLLAGCGVFETRRPEPPSGGGGVFIQPDTPDIVLANLQEAIKSLNTQNYMSCLSDSTFRFVPTSQSAQANPDVWTGWQRSMERLYFDNMRSAAQQSAGQQLQLSNIRLEPQGDNTEQITADYTLTIVTSSTSRDIPSVWTGSMVLRLRANSFGLWSIIYWEDISTSNTSSSWSELKVTFAKSG